MKNFWCLLSLCFMTVGVVGCGGSEDAAETEKPAATDTDDGAGETETDTDGGGE